MMENPQIEMGTFKPNGPQVPNGVLRSSMVQSWILQSTVERVLQSIRTVVFMSNLNLLLPFGPAAIVPYYATRRHGLIFLFSMLGITPLAERLGYATEQLAIYTGPTVGGLLNATFGNATEMIIAIYALKNGMIRVVQQSLLGSILSNMLLVVGCAFFAGGIVHRNKDQVFSTVMFVQLIFCFLVWPLARSGPDRRGAGTPRGSAREEGVGPMASQQRVIFIREHPWKAAPLSSPGHRCHRPPSPVFPPGGQQGQALPCGRQGLRPQDRRRRPRVDATHPPHPPLALSLATAELTELTLIGRY